MTALVLGLALFIGMHSVRIVAPGLRDAAIARLGEGPWKGAYAVVSLVGLVLVGRGWGEASRELLYAPLPGARTVLLVAMLPLLVLLIAGNLPAGRIRRWARHPMMIAALGWSALHLAVNGHAAGIVLFGGLAAWSAVEVASLFSRERAAALGPHGAAPPAPAKPLPWWPDIVAVAAGLGAYAWLVGGGHVSLFGVSPIG